MRRVADAARIRRLMSALSQETERETRVYFTGGASAVLFGWRATTIDVDLRILPESDRLLRAMPALKERLELNIELASPADFIPPIPGWEERSRFIETQARLLFFHYDFYSQALAKIERGHAQDRTRRCPCARRLPCPPTAPEPSAGPRASPPPGTP